MPALYKIFSTLVMAKIHRKILLKLLYRKKDTSLNAPLSILRLLEDSVSNLHQSRTVVLLGWNCGYRHSRGLGWSRRGFNTRRHPHAAAGPGGWLRRERGGSWGGAWHDGGLIPFVRHDRRIKGRQDGGVRQVLHLPHHRLAFWSRRFAFWTRQFGLRLLRRQSSRLHLPFLHCNLLFLKLYFFRRTCNWYKLIAKEVGNCQG